MDTPTTSNNPAVTEHVGQLNAPQLAAQYAASLQRVTAALNTTLISTEVATLALEEALALLKASAGSIMLLRDHGETLEMVAATGYTTDRQARWSRFPVHAHPLAPDALRGHALFFTSKRAMIKRYPQTAAELATSPNHAFVFLPLPLENHVIGAFSLSFSQPRRFPTGERTYLQALAQQCARAFERARLYETEQTIRQQVEQAAQQMAALQAITAALSQAVTVAEVGQVTVEHTARAIRADSSAIGWVVGQELRLTEHQGVATDARWYGIPLDTPIPITEAIRTGQPVFIENPEQGAGRYPTTIEAMTASGRRAWAAIPLAIEGQVAGAVGLGFNAPRPFTPEDRTLMQAVGQQCAQALYRAQLYERERAARTQAERLADRTAALQTITATLSQALTPTQVGQTILNGVTTIFASKTSAVALVQQDLLHIVHVNGIPPESLGTPLTLDMPYTITEAARTGQSIYVQNPQVAIQRYPQTYQSMLADGRQAWAAIPFHIHDNVVGVFSIGFDQPHDFDQEERAILSAISLQCAQALHRAFLYEKEREARAEADRLNNQLELQVATRTAELQWTNAELTAEIGQRLQAEAQLRESEARYRTLIETSPDAIILSDLNMQLLFCNQQATILLGYERIEDIIGRNAFDMIAPESHHYAQSVLSQAITQGSVTNVELFLRRQDGSQFPAEVSGSLLTDTDGHPFAFLTITRDISRRKAAEQRIQREAARTAALARAASRLTGRLELDELLTTISQETAQIFAVPLVIISLYDGEQDNLIIRGGFGLPDWFIQQARPIPAAAYRTWDYGQHGRMDRPYVVPDMRRLPQIPNYDLFLRLNVCTSASITMMREENVVGRLNVCTIGEERTFSEDELQVLELLAAQAAVAIQSAQLYAQLRTNRHHLRRLNQRVITAQEEERQRLSRELHDSVGQMLTALNINISLLAEDVPNENTTLRQNLLEATTLSKEALDQIRSLARELRPVALGPIGLNAVLEAFCQEFSRRTRFPVTYQGIELPTIPDVVGISFYRFLQEGLTNVVKHAHATHAHVHLTWQDGLICLIVEDNGQGISPPDDSTQQPAGVGLLGLRERFNLLGGEIELLSTPGRGTRLLARLKPDPPQ
jgi:PAS domain S-box-containing protein